jgi:hypothetical protein
MSDSDSSSTWKWALGLLIGVPAAWLAILQISDRFSDDAPPLTSMPSTSQFSSPPKQSVADQWPSTSSATDVAISPPTVEPPLRTQPPPSSTTAQEPPTIPVVDGIRIETWAYDKAGLNTYVADNTGGKKIRVSWTSSAGGYEVNGGCASSVRIQGPDTDLAKNSSNCSDSMGTYLDVQQPGNYTVTVTARQDSGAEHSESITVTVVPG